MYKKLITVLIITVLAAVAGFGQEKLNADGNGYEMSLFYELGFVKVLSHTIQFGTTGDGATDFDYVKQGGQEILFPFQRASAVLTLGERHNLIFLYQPLTIETKINIRENIRIDETNFLAGTAMLLKYGFPFWRLSYVFDFISTEDLTIGAGLSFQLRNASIIFQSLDGEQMTVNQNLGPVPILKVWARYDLENGMFFGTEIDGFYASSSFFNGADFEFVGSILDASARVGFRLRENVDSFLNVRFLGGTAAGVSQYEDQYWTQGVADSTSNNLSTLSATLGFTLR